MSVRFLSAKWYCTGCRPTIAFNISWHIECPDHVSSPSLIVIDAVCPQDSKPKIILHMEVSHTRWLQGRMQPGYWHKQGEALRLGISKPRGPSTGLTYRERAVPTIRRNPSSLAMMNKQVTYRRKTSEVYKELIECWSFESSQKTHRAIVLTNLTIPASRLRQGDSNMS